MTDQHVDELIDLYALGALEPGEQVAVDEHLDECPRCRALLEEAKQLVQLFAWTPDQHDPPPALRGKVMQRVAHLQHLQGKTRRSWWERFSLPPWLRSPRLGLQLSGALLLLVALLGWRTVRLQDEIASLRGQLAEQQSLVAVLYAPGTRIVPLAATDPEAPQGYLLFDPSRARAVLKTTALAALPQDKTYQLWLIADNQPESVGLLSVDPNGQGAAEILAQRPIGQYQAFGISVEPAGGSAQPTTTPIILETL
ncbi:MAG TPA: anti-sigma factor [Herpetosiphonaceae bacterium]